MLPSFAEKSSVESLAKKAEQLPNDGVLCEEGWPLIFGPAGHHGRMDTRQISMPDKLCPGRRHQIDTTGYWPSTLWPVDHHSRRKREDCRFSHPTPKASLEHAGDTPPLKVADVVRRLISLRMLRSLLLGIIAARIQLQRVSGFDHHSMSTPKTATRHA